MINTHNKTIETKPAKAKTLKERVKQGTTQAALALSLLMPTACETTAPATRSNETATSSLHEPAEKKESFDSLYRQGVKAYEQAKKNKPADQELYKEQLKPAMKLLESAMTAAEHETDKYLARSMALEVEAAIELKPIPVDNKFTNIKLRKLQQELENVIETKRTMVKMNRSWQLTESMDLMAGLVQDYAKIVMSFSDLHDRFGQMDDDQKLILAHFETRFNNEMKAGRKEHRVDLFANSEDSAIQIAPLDGDGVWIKDNTVSTGVGYKSFMKLSNDLYGFMQEVRAANP